MDRFGPVVEEYLHYSQQYATLTRRLTNLEVVYRQKVVELLKEHRAEGRAWDDKRVAPDSPLHDMHTRMNELRRERVETQIAVRDAYREMIKQSGLQIIE